MTTTVQTLLAAPKTGPVQLNLMLRQLMVTQRELSTEIGVSFDTVSRWCRGCTRPQATMARALNAWLLARGLTMEAAFTPMDGVSATTPPPFKPVLHLVEAVPVEAEAVAEAPTLPTPPRKPKKKESPMAAILPREVAEDDLLEYWGLKTDPFAGPTNPADIWMPPALVRLENRLIEAMKRRQIVALVGEPGSGKSTLFRRLWYRTLRISAIRLIRPAGIDRNEFTHSSIMVACVRDLVGEDVSGLVRERIAERFRQVLADQLGQGLSPVLVIDEAHRLSRTALVAVKEIWDSGDLLQPMAVLMVGQSSLEDRLRRDPHLREVTGRTTIRRIEACDAAAAGEYLAWCCKQAGGAADKIFAPDAVAAIAVRGQYPLWMSNVALAAMRRAMDLGADRVNAGHVGKAGAP